MLAGLFSAGLIRPTHRVLEIGCGNGSESLALAAWGVRYILGIDASAAKIAIARSRATRYRLNARFLRCPVEELAAAVPTGAFDVVLDTLCWSNIHAGCPRRTPTYVRQVARALRPGGLFILQARAAAHPCSAIGPLPSCRPASGATSTSGPC